MEENEWLRSYMEKKIKSASLSQDIKICSVRQGLDPCNSVGLVQSTKPPEAGNTKNYENKFTESRTLDWARKYEKKNEKIGDGPILTIFVFFGVFFLFLEPNPA